MLEGIQPIHILLILGAAIFFQKDIKKILNMNNQQQLPTQITRIKMNDLERRVDDLVTRLDSVKAYDDTSVRKCISAINLHLTSLAKWQNYLNGRMIVLKKNSEAKQLNQPIYNVPPLRPKVIIKPELKKSITDAYATGNFSIRGIADRLKVKRHIVERCLKGIDKEKILERDERYIG